MEMVICQETPSHGKNIYGNLTAARHAPSKKVRYTRYCRFLRCAFLSVKQNYGKIRPRRAAVVCLPMSNLFSIPKILSVTIYLYTLLLYNIYIYTVIYNIYIYLYIYIINNILCKHTTSTTYFGLSSQEAWCDGEPSLRGQVTAAAQPACPQRLRDQDAGPLQSLFESGFKHQQ